MEVNIVSAYKTKITNQLFARKTSIHQLKLNTSLSEKKLNITVKLENSTPINRKKN